MSEEDRGALAGTAARADLANSCSRRRFVAAALGDFGADVVKVEPPHGERLPTSRRLAQDARCRGRSQDGNKRTVVLDPETPSGS